MTNLRRDIYHAIAEPGIRAILLLVASQEGKQKIVITRGFDLPLSLLSKKYLEPTLLNNGMEASRG